MKLIAMLATIALAGCASTPPGPALNWAGQVATRADAGLVPTHLTDDMIRQLLRFKRYKDPDGARIDNIVGPVFVNLPTDWPFLSVYGWGYCFDVNARNGFGAFVGYRKALLVFRSTDPDAAILEIEDPDWSTQRAYVARACRSVAG